MMRCSSFGRGAVFAAIVAAAYVPFLLLVAPLLGVWNARALYLCGAAAAYIALSAPPGRGATALFVAVGGVLAAALAHTTGELAVVLAGLIAIARGVLLYPGSPARTLTRELALGMGGLAFARFLVSSTIPSISLALWGFFLVQSFFFLAPPTATPVAEPDRFEQAYRRAVALLDR